MARDLVIESIRHAFAGTTRPARENFVQCEQCEIFVGRLLASCPASWEEIRSDYIPHESSALTALTPLGWQFLLPAYMIWHLQNYSQCTDSNTIDNVISNLTWSEDMDEHLVAGYRTLTHAQVRAVDAFLAFIAEQNDDVRLAADAAKARALYWAKAAG